MAGGSEQEKREQKRLTWSKSACALPLTNDRFKKFTKDMLSVSASKTSPAKRDCRAAWKCGDRIPLLMCHHWNHLEGVSSQKPPTNLRPIEPNRYPSQSSICGTPWKKGQMSQAQWCSKPGGRLSRWHPPLLDILQKSINSVFSSRVKTQSVENLGEMKAKKPCC